MNNKQINKTPASLSRESPSDLIEQQKKKLEIAKIITRTGLDLHDHNHGENSADPKDYHGSEHPETLVSHAKMMADIFKCSLEELSLAEMMFAYHDTVINYKKPNPNDLLDRVVRNRGALEGDNQGVGVSGNEAQSAELLKEKMRDAKVFTPEEIETGVFGIHTTYTDVNFGAVFKDYAYYDVAKKQNPELGSLIEKLGREDIEKGLLLSQPHLEKALEEKKKVSPAVLVVALMDFGAAGFAGSEEFFQGGDAEMRELYYNIKQPEAMSRLTTGEGETDASDRARVAKAFLAWVDVQPSFAVWQALRFEKIIYLLKQNNGINAEQEKGLREFFGNYSANINAALSRAKSLRAEYDKSAREDEKKAFISLTHSMHYKT